MQIFKRLMPHKATRTTPAEFQKIYTRLDAKMCGLTQKWAFEALESGNFLTLLNIADNERLGKTKAILYAYRFGYLAGKDGSENE